MSFTLAVIALNGCGKCTPAAREVSSKQACLANLKQIEGAKMTWAIEYNKTTNDIPAQSDLYGETNYIRHVLICPHGGTYTIGRVGEPPRCSCPQPGLPREPDYAAQMQELLEFNKKRQYPPNGL